MKTDKSLQYTRAEKIQYYIKRHLVFILLVSGGILYMSSQNIVTETGEVIESGNSLLLMIASGLVRSFMGVWGALIILKFAFPKIQVQTELVEEHNLAVGVIVAAMIIAMSL